MTATPAGTDAGVRPRVRDGRWRTVAPGPLGWLALAAALADLVTTWGVLTDPARYEGNRVLALAAEVDPLVAMAVLAVWTGSLVAVCWLELGWLATMAGWFTVVVHGVSGGVHNLLARRFGFYLNAELGGALAAEVLFPALGVLVGLAAARRSSGRLPPREIAVLLGVVPLVAARMLLV